MESIWTTAPSKRTNEPFGIAAKSVERDRLDEEEELRLLELTAPEERAEEEEAPDEIPEEFPLELKETATLEDEILSTPTGLPEAS